MSITAEQRTALLQQLTQLVSDSQVCQLLDQETAQKIRHVAGYYDLKDIWLYEQKFTISQSFQRNKKHKTQAEQLNDLYEEKFAKLFSDYDPGVLKQITINSENKSNYSLNNTLTKNSRQLTKQSMFNKKQSTKLFTQTTPDVIIPNLCHSRSQLLRTQPKMTKSKQKLITYKIQSSTGQVQKQSAKKLTCVKPEKNFLKVKQKEKTQSRIDERPKSRSAGKKPKRSQSQCQNKKFFNCTAGISLQSTSKIALSTLQSSQLKSSSNLLMGSKFNSCSKKSLQSTVKQMKSFATFVDKVCSASSSKYHTKESKARIQDQRGQPREKMSKSRQHHISRGKLSKCKSNNKVVLSKSRQKKQRLFTQVSYENNPRQFYLHDGNELFDGVEIQVQNRSKCKKSMLNDKRRVVTQQNNNNWNERQYQSQEDISKSAQPQKHPQPCYLQQAITHITQLQQAKQSQLHSIQSQVQLMKQQLFRQQKQLQSITVTNNKLSQELVEVQSSTQATKSTKVKLTSCIQQLKSVIRQLGVERKEKQMILEKMVEEKKQEEELIVMFENVVKQLKKELKQQAKMRNQLLELKEKEVKRLDGKLGKCARIESQAKQVKLGIMTAFGKWV